MTFRHGDRVRIRKKPSEYTGCRGGVVDPEGEAPPPGTVPLGHFVAIDGENGKVRPFLADDLERVRPARVRPAPANRKLETEEG